MCTVSVSQPFDLTFFKQKVVIITRTIQLRLALDTNPKLLLHQTRYCLRPKAVCVLEICKQKDCHLSVRGFIGCSKKPVQNYYVFKNLDAQLLMMTTFIYYFVRLNFSTSRKKGCVFDLILICQCKKWPFSDAVTVVSDDDDGSIFDRIFLFFAALFLNQRVVSKTVFFLF